MDPFQNPFSAPSGPDIKEFFSRPKSGRAVRSAKRDADAGPAQEPETEADKGLQGEREVQDPEPKPKPVVLLQNPKWSRATGAFNETIRASVECDLPQESTHLTRVEFTLFAQLPDVKVDRIEKKDGYIRDGVAEIEFSLWSPDYRAADGNLLEECEYVFVAKHRDSKELKSGILPVANRKKPGKGAGRQLQRGMRGEDVFSWQRFLMGLRRQPEYTNAIHEIEVDGIFGLETQKATRDFQSNAGLIDDGIVGIQTRDAAGKLGASFEEVAKGAGDTVAAELVRQGKIPLIPTGPPSPPSQPAPGPKGSTREESWKRLRGEGWKNVAKLTESLVQADAVIQSAADGTGDFVYDEYSVEVEKMPSGLDPEQFLKEMALDLNGTVRNPGFDQMNVFKRRRAGPLSVGELIDIDILLTDNGAVVLAEMGSTYFIFQTVDCPEMGSHPENGSREFGFQIIGSKVVFYTRGVSRPGNVVIGYLGAWPQEKSWTSMMEGISSQINVRGGKSEFTSFSTRKEKREH